jgi:hypothetical protein
MQVFRSVYAVENERIAPKAEVELSAYEMYSFLLLVSTATE